MIILDAPVFWVVMIVAFVVGFGLVPTGAGLLSPSLPKSIRTALGRVIWTMAAVIHGPYVLWWPPRDGWPELYPADPEQDAALVDGEWREFDADGNWSVLGMQPFGISYQKSPDAFGELLDEEPPRVDGDTEIVDARGGMPVVSRTFGDGYVVDILTAVDRWQSAASTRLNSKGKDEAMQEHGGDTAEMTNKQLIIGVLMSMLLGGVFGVLLFGGVV